MTVRNRVKTFILLFLSLAWLTPGACAGTPASFAQAVATGRDGDLSLTASFVPASDDVGRPLSIFVLAAVPRPGGDVLLARGARGWAALTEFPPPVLRSEVGAAGGHSLEVAGGVDVRGIPGTRAYLGYGIGDSAAAAFDEMLRSQRYRMVYRVVEAVPDSGMAAPGALGATTEAELTAIFRKALGVNGDRQSPWLGGTGLVAPVVSVGTTTSVTVSSTTLQEAGVDEADLVKADGSALFSLDPTGDRDGRRSRLRRQWFGSELSPGGSLDLPFSADVGGSGLYLDGERRQVVAVAQGNPGYGVYDLWFSPWSWMAGTTEVAVVDVAGDRMRVRDTLRLGGQLIGSRRLGATLYLVLRSYPQVLGLDPLWPDSKLAGNQALIDTLQAAHLLPTLAVNGGAARPLVDAADCLAQADNANGSADIVTIVALDLAAAGVRYAARCFVGGSEAFYVSERALYLATTRYGYARSGAFPRYADRTSTDIHKFSLDGLNIVYRGSGNVVGHLGFDQNRKSFRMGEHDGALRVLTQTASSFGGWVPLAATTTVGTDGASDSPGKLTVLQERAGTLATVGELPNAARPAPLGKPGEQLYASRFLGTRGFLVTYRLTDPLYVLDLSNPTDPKILGELQVSGYSDYLFPITGNLLLGVGKEAISDGRVGDGRSAWYQGVKLALIDVTDTTRPREAARAIIGRRGTDATVLHDHHGIAIQDRGTSVRVSLPVSLHETPPASVTGAPNDYYLFTRSELRKFEIDPGAKSLGERGALMSSVNGERSIANDRSVLWNDQVHYYRNGDWQSGAW